MTVKAVVEAGFEESLCRATCTTERGNKEHCFFKERHFNYFAYRLWQVIDFSVVALCFWLVAWSKEVFYFGCFSFKCLDERSNSQAERYAS